MSSPSKISAELVLPLVVLTNDSPIKNNASDALPILKYHVSPMYPRKLKPETLYERRQCLNHRFASPRLLHLSPCRAHRPSSRNSLSSRLSSSHNSLASQFQADDSSFITQAISHDALTAKSTDITDMYNVPFDSDIYAVPIDMVRPQHVAKGKKSARSKKRAKSTQQTSTSVLPSDKIHKPKENRHKDGKTKRHSLPSSSSKKNTADSEKDSLHLTLREMRKYLHTLYSSSSDSECKATVKRNNTLVSNVGVHVRQANKESPPVFLKENNEYSKSVETNNNNRKSSKNSFGMNAKNKKHKENIPKDDIEKGVKRGPNQRPKMSPVRILSINLKQSFCNLFRWKRPVVLTNTELVSSGGTESPREGVPAAVRRALPPLPQSPQPSNAPRKSEDDNVADFATSIQKVKDVSIDIFLS